MTKSLAKLRKHVDLDIQNIMTSNTFNGFSHRHRIDYKNK